ncbi:hypothetical protein AB0A76_07840 [Streptomyces exfoliatus]|uniref:Uncharacterized protein n=1 Tax=Streptomyces exfoliatus TaxID=1905 RepID=A0ABV3CSB0_STREX
MMEEALTVLAASGGSAVVAAMATDAWQTARGRVVRLFRHDGDSQQASVGAQLDGGAQLVAQAETLEKARQVLLPYWQLQLTEFLRRHPDAADELRSLAADVTAALPAVEQRWVQHNQVSGPGSLYAALGGNVIVHQTAAAPPTHPPTPNHPPAPTHPPIPSHSPTPPGPETAARPDPATGADRGGDR